MRYINSRFTLLYLLKIRTTTAYSLVFILGFRNQRRSKGTRGPWFPIQKSAPCGTPKCSVKCFHRAMFVLVNSLCLAFFWCWYWIWLWFNDQCIYSQYFG